jgi:pimeloyl-ACP methyl ester carboxylesterase
MPFVQRSPVNLYYVEKGAGEPVIFLSGLSGDHGSWMGQLRAFSRHFRTLVLDNRDVGRSGSAPRPYTIRDMAADVAELLDQLAIPRAHVVGVSMGGMMAQELALARPPLVKSLALVCTLAHADDWFRATLDAFGLIRRQVADTAGFFEAILPWWVSHRFFEQSDRITWLRWLLRQSPLSQSLEGFQRQLQAIGGHNTLDRLHQIRCPVLVLAGEDDSVAPPRYSRQIVARLPHAQMEILPGVGHAPPLENPAMFNHRLAEFLRGMK